MAHEIIIKVMEQGAGGVTMPTKDAQKTIPQEAKSDFDIDIQKKMRSSIFGQMRTRRIVQQIGVQGAMLSGDSEQLARRNDAFTLANNMWFIAISPKLGLATTAISIGLQEQRFRNEQQIDAQRSQMARQRAGFTNATYSRGR